MRRKKKKKSPFQKLTIFMALLMAIVTLFGVFAYAIQYMAQ